MADTDDLYQDLLVDAVCDLLGQGLQVVLAGLRVGDRELEIVGGKADAHALDAGFDLFEEVFGGQGGSGVVVFVRTGNDVEHHGGVGHVAGDGTRAVQR